MNAIRDLVLNFIVNALWQVAVVAAVAALCDWWLKRVAAARQRHIVWVAALLLGIALPLWSALPLPRATLHLAPLSAPDAVAPTATPAQTSPAQTLPQPPDNRATWRHLPFGQIIVGLYLLFLLYRLRKLWRAWKLTSAIRRSAFPVTASSVLQAVLTQCRTALGTGEVALFGSPSVTVPVTVGVRQPVIIVPERLLTEISDDLLSAALGHELAHIRRRDFAWNLVYEFLFLPLSFHPAAVLVKRRINETRELACDEIVSASLMDAQPYANALVKLASFAAAANHPTYLLGVSDANILEERIMKLLAKKTSANTRRATALPGITLFALAMVGVGAAALPLSFQQEAALPPNTRQLKAPQHNNPAAAARFVGTWRGFGNSPDPDEHVIVFTMEGEKLVGTYRIGPREFKPLPELRVAEKEVSWKEKDIRGRAWVYLTKARLISEDKTHMMWCFHGKSPGPTTCMSFTRKAGR